MCFQPAYPGADVPLREPAYASMLPATTDSTIRRACFRPVPRAIQHAMATEALIAQISFSKADLDAVLRQRHQLLNFISTDLEGIYRQAEMGAALWPAAAA